MKYCKGTSNYKGAIPLSHTHADDMLMIMAYINLLDLLAKPLHNLCKKEPKHSNKDNVYSSGWRLLGSVFYF